MKKIITLISILLLISLSACSDSSSGMGPSQPGGDDPTTTETGVYTHGISWDGETCTEYYIDSPERIGNPLVEQGYGGDEGKCPKKYSTHCEIQELSAHSSKQIKNTSSAKYSCEDMGLSTI